MKKVEKSMGIEQCSFNELDASFFLLGLLSAFDNRYQAKADNFFEEISWKQFFAICCINLCEEPPSIKGLAEIMGSSHQNVKQILNKLERKEYIQIISDQNDKRVQRVVVTEKMKAFLKAHDEGSQIVVSKIFEGIAPEDIATTISTISKMEKNLDKI